MQKRYKVCEENDLMNKVLSPFKKDAGGVFKKQQVESMNKLSKSRAIEISSPTDNLTHIVSNPIKTPQTAIEKYRQFKYSKKN